MIHEAWFTFKGVDSREMGVIVTAMPETVRAERRIESIQMKAFMKAMTGRWNVR